MEKNVLREAFHDLLPLDIVYRKKEQFPDGIGHQWIDALQEHAMKTAANAGVDRVILSAPESLKPTSQLPPTQLSEADLRDAVAEVVEGVLETVAVAAEEDGVQCEARLYSQLFETRFGSDRRTFLARRHRLRRAKRRQIGNGRRDITVGSDIARQWCLVADDSKLADLVTLQDTRLFLANVLGLGALARASLPLVNPQKSTLVTLISAMLHRVPFHNASLLIRPRRPPTLAEIRLDMLSGIGGPCSVVNTFFASVLNAIGFRVGLLSCTIAKRADCHVALLVEIDGRFHFVDVGNGKPYFDAVPLGDRSIRRHFDFYWRLVFDDEHQHFAVLHGHNIDESTSSIAWNCALTFEFRTVPFSSFHAMIQKARSDESFGPFLRGFRVCRYPEALSIVAVRNRTLLLGNTKENDASCDELIRFLGENFADVNDLVPMLTKALALLEAGGHLNT